MPDSVSPPVKALIKKLLLKDPSKRATIYDVIKEPIIQSKITLIVEEYTLGEDIAESIKEQLVALNLLGSAAVQEEKK